MSNLLIESLQTLEIRDSGPQHAVLDQESEGCTWDVCAGKEISGTDFTGTVFPLPSSGTSPPYIFEENITGRY